MVRKHYYNFHYSADMLKKGHVDLTVRNTVMLIKFSKQIANSFAKIIHDYKDAFKTSSNV